MNKKLRELLLDAARENGRLHGKVAELDFGAGAEWMYEKLKESPVIGEESPAQSTKEICHTAPSTAMAKCQQVEMGL
jgi:hypothetical protein